MFVAVSAGAVVLYLYAGRNQWFSNDEWDFLVDRNPASLGDLFQPHNEHWSTIPILAYRVTFRIFGLRSYVPYQLPLILMHVGVASLMRVVMRRSGVAPWIATACAGLFVLFGAGHENIVWAFQIGFVGSILFGFVQLVLAGHDGRIDRRDAAAIGAGLAALLCSGVGVTMVGVVGVATLIRRGWRAAIVQTAPLAAVFLVWYFAIGRDDYNSAHSDTGAIVDFVARGIGSTFDALGQVSFFGWVLALVLVLGLVVVARSGPLPEVRRRVAAPVALLLGSAVFMTTSALGRAVLFGSQFATASRYLYIVGALTLPALGLAASAISERWRVLTIPLIVCFLVGIPGNLDVVLHRNSGPTRFFNGEETLVRALPRVPAAKEVPRSLHPLPDRAPQLTMGWLLDNAADGRIPAPDRIAPIILHDINGRLSLEQVEGDPEATPNCAVLRAPETIAMQKGDAVGIRGFSITAHVTAPDGAAIVRYGPVDGNTLVARRGPLEVQFESNLSVPPELCR